MVKHDNWVNHTRTLIVHEKCGLNECDVDSLRQAEKKSVWKLIIGEMMMKSQPVEFYPLKYNY